MDSEYDQLPEPLETSLADCNPDYVKQRAFLVARNAATARASSERGGRSAALRVKTVVPVRRFSWE